MKRNPNLTLVGSKPAVIKELPVQELRAHPAVFHAYLTNRQREELARFLKELRVDFAFEQEER